MINRLGRVFPHRDRNQKILHFRPLQTPRSACVARPPRSLVAIPGTPIFPRILIAVALSTLFGGQAAAQAIPTTLDLVPLPSIADAPPFVVQAAYDASCIDPLAPTASPPPATSDWIEQSRTRANEVGLAAPSPVPIAAMPRPGVPSNTPQFDPGAMPFEPEGPSFDTPPPNRARLSPNTSERFPHPRKFLRDVGQDYGNYYSLHHAMLLGMAFGGGAVMANTNWDQHWRDSYQNHVGYSSAVHNFHIFGEGKIMLPTYAGLMALGWVFDDYLLPRAAGIWAEQTLRAAIVGAPPMLLMQKVTGGSRPDDGTWGSQWRFFQDNNGVSGHAFMGALPFLTAARLTDRPLLKLGFFAGSTLTGWSRFGDDQHYMSQVMLGWAMAGVAVSAVGQTETGQPFRVVPWVTPGGAGFGWEFRR